MGATRTCRGDHQHGQYYLETGPSGGGEVVYRFSIFQNGAAEAARDEPNSFADRRRTGPAAAHQGLQESRSRHRERAHGGVDQVVPADFWTSAGIAHSFKAVQTIGQVRERRFTAETLWARSRRTFLGRLDSALRVSGVIRSSELRSRCHRYVAIGVERP